MASSALETSVDRLFDNARMRLPGVVDNALYRELYETLKEFFTLSSAWQGTAEFEAEPDVLVYPIVPIEHGKIVRLVGLTNSTLMTIPAILTSTCEVKLSYAPSAVDTYTATLVLTVRDPVTQQGHPFCPQWLFEKYSGAITDGLLGRMMSQIAKPYTSERYSIYHLRRFRDAIATARAETSHANLQRGQAWRFPGFATGSQR